jgi:hypothetical protein
MLQAIPGLIVYDFPLPADEDLIWELCSFASREIIHLIRSSRLGNQFRILTSLTTLGHIHSDKRKLLSQILFRLQEFFKADGVSLIEVLTVEHMKFRLEKTYVHKGRDDTDTFVTDHGMAVYCVSRNKALLITKSLWNAPVPHALGLSLTPSISRSMRN